MIKVDRNNAGDFIQSIVIYFAGVNKFRVNTVICFRE